MAQKTHMLAVFIAALMCLCGSAYSRTLLDAAPGKFYISITSSDRTVQQGQQPKIVAQFGNIGGSEITNPYFDCYYTDDQSPQAVVFIHEELYYQKLIPGQNQNAEHQYVAKNLGTTHRYCLVSGTTMVNGRSTTVSAKSNTVDVTVVPQQG